MPTTTGSNDIPLLSCVLLGVLSTMACAKAAPEQTPAPVPIPGTQPAIATSKPRPDAEAVEVSPPSKVVALDAHGLSFKVPAVWRVEESTAGVMVSAPETGELAGVTIAVQAVRKNPAKGPADLAALKKTLLAELRGERRAGKLLRDGVFEREGIKGMRIETRFDHEGKARRKDQVLFDRGAFLISLSFNAPDAIYARGYPIWEAALKSLATESAAE